MAEPSQKCAYCGEVRALVRSHAIPDALFKDLKASRGGSLRQIHQDLGISTTSTSGYARLLCGECEARFNRLCDHDAISAIRQSVAANGAGTCPHQTLAHFICSVLWRALESSAKIYSGYRVPQEDRERIKDVVFERCQPFDMFSFEVAMLFDGQGELGAGQLSQAIAVPYWATTTIGEKKYSIHHFIVRGVFMAALSPRVLPSLADSRYLAPNGAGLPNSVRDIRTLSSFSKIAHLAKQKAKGVKY